MLGLKEKTSSNKEGEKRGIIMKANHKIIIALALALIGLISNGFNSSYTRVGYWLVMISILGLQFISMNNIKE